MSVSKLCVKIWKHHKLRSDSFLNTVIPLWWIFPWWKAIGLLLSLWNAWQQCNAVYTLRRCPLPSSFFNTHSTFHSLTTTASEIIKTVPGNPLMGVQTQICFLFHANELGPRGLRIYATAWQTMICIYSFSPSLTLTHSLAAKQNKMKQKIISGRAQNNCQDH